MSWMGLGDCMSRQPGLKNQIVIYTLNETERTMYGNIQTDRFYINTLCQISDELKMIHPCHGSYIDGRLAGNACVAHAQYVSACRFQS